MKELFLAICRENNKKVEELLSGKNIGELNICDKYGRTPLVYAVLLSNLDIVNTLLRYGASVNFRKSDLYSNSIEQCVKRIENINDNIKFFLETKKRCKDEKEFQMLDNTKYMCDVKELKKSREIYDILTSFGNFHSIF